MSIPPLVRAASVLVVVTCVLALAWMAFAQSEKRYVPQQTLSVLLPVKVAFHPSRAALILVVSAVGHVDLLDTTVPSRPLKMAGILAGAGDAAFSPRGDRVVSGGADGTVRLWRLDGTPVGEPFQGHERGVTSVAFSPQGDRIVSGGDDGTVRLWRLDGSPAAEPFEGHEPDVLGGVWSVAFSPQGDRIVSGGADGAVRLWRLDAPPIAERFKGGIPSEEPGLIPL